VDRINKTGIPDASGKAHPSGHHFWIEECLMLDVKKNRLDYGEQLVPPDNSYDLDYAVGTTYSLDLEAIMVLPVALFYSRLLDCNPDELHFDVLDAITRAADKIRIFCQKGKIKVPKKYNRLMAYWEKGISEIRMDSHVSSFHPKVWVARFSKQDKIPFYRLLITSRNLTYAHDWDIAFASEGYVGDKLIEKNTPLISFLQYLEKQDGTKFPKEFLAGLYKVDFKLPDGFHLLNFHPIGFESQENRTTFTNPLQKKSWKDLLVISPFVDDATISNLAEKSEKSLNVLSRKEELDSISEALIIDIRKNCFFQFSEFIRDAENIDGLSDGSHLEILPQNLHAKIFIGSKSGYQHWFIGSANCTHPAFGRNIEFMVELKTDQSSLSPLKICKMLTQAKNEELPPFEPYQLKNRVVDTVQIGFELKLRKIIYDRPGYALRVKLFHVQLGLKHSGMLLLGVMRRR
jgi:HKD family nuclease